MDPNYAPASTRHTIDSIEVPQQEKPAKSEAPVKKNSETESSAMEGLKKQSAVQEVPEVPMSADAVLEEKIALMDPDKAKKIRDAMAARAQS